MIRVTVDASGVPLGSLNRLITEGTWRYLRDWAYLSSYATVNGKVRIRVVCEDESGKMLCRVLGPEDIRRGLTLAYSALYNGEIAPDGAYGCTLLSATHDVGYLDANGIECVVQFALFGKIVYA